MLKPKSVALICFLFSLVLLLSLGALLALSQPYYRPHLPFLLLYVAVVAALGSAAIKKNRGGSLLLSLTVLHFLVPAPELGFRMLRFRYQSGVQFAYPSSFESLRRDPDLFWTLPPERADVNRLGFKGREIPSPKATGRYRILFLGDSVPAQGYPCLLEQQLNHGRPSPAVECINLSTVGYSSFQGRRVTERYGALLEADLVVVSYGWNDHWQAYGSTDAKKRIPPRLAWQEAAQWIYDHSRLLQAGRFLLKPVLKGAKPLGIARVPPEAYMENLKFIQDFFSRKGVDVLFITPPSGHAATGVPDDLVHRGFALDKQTIMRDHRRYNRLLRTWLKAHPQALIDMEREWQKQPAPEQLFLKDGIHLSQEGLHQMAAALAKRIERRLAAAMPR